MLIYPSILEKTPEAFFRKLELLLPHFSHFQVDIVDGLFVPGKTLQIEEIETGFKIKDLRFMNKTFEFHLMVKDYEKEIEKLEKLQKNIKITSVLIHLKALLLDPSTQLRFARDDRTWDYGLVLNPEDDVVQNWETIKQFSTVQLMTVHPGAQGTPFVPEVLSKIDELRERGFSGKIILDGAINDKTLSFVLNRKNLPDAICPGSYFAENVEDGLKTLEKMVEDRR